LTISKTNSLLPRGIVSLADHRQLKRKGTGEAKSMARREVQSEITGRVWKVEAQPGERVTVDQPIVILESMKMEIPISAPIAGRVAEVLVSEKDVVEEGQIVAVLDV
jgi:acetyl-CoA carboxylase biotin carboxyl carrier protein